MAARLVDRQQIGLLCGLHNAQRDSKFFARLAKERPQKEALAGYISDHCGLQCYVDHISGTGSGGLPTLFFESGSTVAFPIGMFAKSLLSAAKAQNTNPLRQLTCRVLTNSFAALTALAGLVKEVDCVQGGLSLDYYGFFPFSDQTPTSSDGWSKEQKRYNDLADDIADCDTVFATCSNLSLLYGPTVGSRANCLTKSAICSGWNHGATRRDDSGRIYILLHFQKLVPLLTDVDGLSFDAPQERCKCVFPSDPSQIASGRGDWITSLESDSMYWDSTNWNGTVLTRQDEIVPILTTWKNRKGATHVNTSSWVEWLTKAHGVSILISLPIDTDIHPGIRKKASIFTVREVNRTNDLFQSCGFQKRYVIANAATLESDGVVRLEIVNA